MVLWLDFMKYGVVSSTELNNTVELVSRALGALPSQSCCFCIAPQMSSERRSGLREEWRLLWVAPLAVEGVQIPLNVFHLLKKKLQPRTLLKQHWACSIKLVRRIEDKFEAKSLKAEDVYIRCEPPPTAKRVPLLFPGWLVTKSDCVDNVFQSCSLLHDRILWGLGRGICGCILFVYITTYCCLAIIRYAINILRYV